MSEEKKEPELCLGDKCRRYNEKDLDGMIAVHCPVAKNVKGTDPKRMVTYCTKPSRQILKK